MQRASACPSPLTFPPPGRAAGRPRWRRATWAWAATSSCGPAAPWWTVRGPRAGRHPRGGRQLPRARTRMHTCSTHTCTHAHVHARTHACMDICHTYTHTHTRAHARTRARTQTHAHQLVPPIPWTLRPQSPGDPGLVGNLLVERMAGAVVHKVGGLQQTPQPSKARSRCLALRGPSLRAPGSTPMA